MDNRDVRTLSEIPLNQAAEEAVLGCVMSGVSPFAVQLSEGHFACPARRLIFRACCDLAHKGITPDIQSVTAHLTSVGELPNAGGPGAVTALLTSHVYGAGEATMKHYYEHLEQMRQVREVFKCVSEHLPELRGCRLTALDFLARVTEACGASTTSETKTAKDLAEEIEKDALSDPSALAVALGLPALDLKLQGGALPGELFVVAADTGVGKSALLIQTCAEAVLRGKNALYISLEMKSKEVFKRIVSAAFGIPQSSPDFQAATKRASRLGVSFRDDLSTLPDILGAIVSEVRSKDTALIIVDYLQLVSNNEESRELAMSGIARALKSVALQNNVVVLTASQINEKGQLRESRAIGHHADAVLWIDSLGVKLGKLRRGPGSIKVRCRLNGALSRFEQKPGPVYAKIEQ